jgi:type I restriction enzyme S subunit
MSNKFIILGKSCKLNKESINSKKIPKSIYYLDTGNITRNVIKELHFFSKESGNYPSRAKRKVSDQTIIYSSVRPNQEHFGFIKNPQENLIVSTGFVTIDVEDSELDPLFLYYLITRKEITIYLQTIAENSTSSYPSINPEDLGKLKLRVPSNKSDQKKIASVLSALDAKIELNNRINAELEKMAKTLYDYWFVQFDFPDCNGKPYKSSGGKMIWNEELKRQIPEGWGVGNLLSSKYTKIVPTGVEKFQDEKIYLSTSEVENNQIINHSIKTDYLNRKSRANMQPKPKTIWFARMKDTKKIIFVDDYCKELIENYIFSTGFAGIETKNESFYFLWLYINSQDFEDIKNKFATGTTQKSITNEGIEKIKILIPNPNILNLFDNKLKNIYKNIYKNNQQNQTLINLRDWLLPMLMNGQVKVE